MCMSSKLWAASMASAMLLVQLTDAVDVDLCSFPRQATHTQAATLFVQGLNPTFKEQVQVKAGSSPCTNRFPGLHVDRLSRKRAA